MKKLTHFVIAPILISLLSGSIYAAELKIGIVNLNAVLQKSPLAVSLNQDLTKRFQPRQAEVVAAQKLLQDDTDKLNINAGTMSIDDQNKLKNKIASDQANFQVLTVNFQKDLEIAKANLTQKFGAKLNEVIKSIATTGNYDIIEQSNNMLFIKPELDITQQVLSQVK